MGRENWGGNSSVYDRSPQMWVLMSYMWLNGHTVNLERFVVKILFCSQWQL